MILPPSKTVLSECRFGVTVAAPDAVPGGVVQTVTTDFAPEKFYAPTSILVQFSWVEPSTLPV